MGPECNNKRHYERKAERDWIRLQKKAMWPKHDARLMALKIEEGAKSQRMQLSELEKAPKWMFP